MPNPTPIGPAPQLQATNNVNNNAVRQSSLQAALSRRPTSSATVIQLSAVPGGRGAADAAPARGRRRGGDLVLGGILAIVLLVACLGWEVLSRSHEASHAALEGPHDVVPAAVR